ncbi:hypothetical protein [uncultured Propionivibrio sp.]|uniref:hypothetical protein n=1 Tax=uncultured Propionivibrio sp. TaxID=426737 RepID=UPI0029C01391|nr:hypothetical protein [uncultured Propionivibrio sp.]
MTLTDPGAPSQPRYRIAVDALQRPEMTPPKTSPSAPRKPRKTGKTVESVEPVEPDDVADKTTPPNSEPAKAGKRRRLARAFSYPLDEVLRNKNETGRERISLPKRDYDALVALKEQLLAQGVEVRKRDLVRLGLQLLREKTDGEIVILLGKLLRKSAGGKK